MGKNKVNKAKYLLLIKIKRLKKSEVDIERGTIK